MEFWRLTYSHVVDNNGDEDEVEAFFETLKDAMSYIAMLHRSLEFTDIRFDKCYMELKRDGDEE